MGSTLIIESAFADTSCGQDRQQNDDRQIFHAPPFKKCECESESIYSIYNRILPGIKAYQGQSRMEFLPADFSLTLGMVVLWLLAAPVLTGRQKTVNDQASHYKNANIIEIIDLK